MTAFTSPYLTVIPNNSKYSTTSTFGSTSTLKFLYIAPNLPHLYHAVTIRVPKVPFHVFDKLKNEIQKFIIKFCFYHNMKNEIQIIDYYFHVKIDLCFEFLMLSFVFHFHKKWKTKHSWFFVFHFHEGIEK